MSDEPTAVRRAGFPPDYGSRGSTDDTTLPWDQVEQKLRDAPNYWLVTVTAGGRSHPRPVDGVWVDGALCFGGSPDTRWVRNLDRDPRATVHLPSGDDVVILEGTAELVTDPAHPLADASQAASRAKYPQYYGADATGSGHPEFSPFWVLRPDVAYAWTLAGFPNRATRWTFAR